MLKGLKHRLLAGEKDSMFTFFFLTVQVFPARDGWPFPVYYGACGRLVVVEDCGTSLETTLAWPWHKRRAVAISLIRAVRALTENKEGYAIYLFDLSLQNFAVGSNGDVRIIDAEHVLAVDLRDSRAKSEL